MALFVLVVFALCLLTVPKESAREACEQESCKKLQLRFFPFVWLRRAAPQPLVCPQMPTESWLGNLLSWVLEYGPLSYKPWSHISVMIHEESPDIYLMRAANPNRASCGCKKNFKQSPWAGCYPPSSVNSVHCGSFSWLSREGGGCQSQGTQATGHRTSSKQRKQHGPRGMVGQSGRLTSLVGRPS